MRRNFDARDNVRVLSVRTALIHSTTPGGRLHSSRVVNHTATFTFYIGDRYFGVITAAVDGPAAQEYRFTSALPIAVLKLLAPQLERRLAGHSLDGA